jgi:hypothetical protein
MCREDTEPRFFVAPNALTYRIQSPRTPEIVKNAEMCQCMAKNHGWPIHALTEICMLIEGLASCQGGSSLMFRAIAVARYVQTIGR